MWRVALLAAVIAAGLLLAGRALSQSPETLLPDTTLAAPPRFVVFEEFSNFL